MQVKVKNPRKQRKRLFNAPAHIRHKLMAAPLTKELAEKQGVKTLPVRKGDTVHIQRGDNKGFEGKVSRIDLKIYRIYIEGLTREKVDGTNIFLPVHPSKVMIKNLNLDDKKRKAIIGRKKPLEKEAAPKPTQKPALTIKAKPKRKVIIEEEVETAAKPAAKKAPAAKKDAESKPSAKPKTPKKTEGGQ
jgi:large subunit ribosomal protein L24